MFVLRSRHRVPNIPFKIQIRFVEPNRLLVKLLYARACVPTAHVVLQNEILYLNFQGFLRGIFVKIGIFLSLNSTFFQSPRRIFGILYRWALSRASFAIQLLHTIHFRVVGKILFSPIFLSI